MITRNEGFQLGLNILSAIQHISAIWDVRYWEISQYLTKTTFKRTSNAIINMKKLGLDES